MPFGVPYGVFGVPYGAFGVLWGVLRELLGSLWGLWGHLGGPDGVILGLFGVILGGSQWGHFWGLRASVQRLGSGGDVPLQRGELWGEDHLRQQPGSLHVSHTPHRDPQTLWDPIRTPQTQWDSIRTSKPYETP